MSLRHLLVGAAIVVATAFSSGCTQLPPEQDVCTQEIEWGQQCEEPERNQSIEVILDVDEEDLTYEDLVNNNERSWNFLPLTYDAFPDSFWTYHNIIENLRIIKEVDEADEVKPEHRKLKNLLERIDRDDTKSIYQRLSLHKINVLEKSGSVTIDRLFNGEEGDCSNISAAYFAVYHYLDKPVYLKFGEVRRPTSDDWGAHAWISLEYQGKTVDLDPMWYDGFIPLEIRNKDVVSIGFDSVEARIKPIYWLVDSVKAWAGVEEIKPTRRGRRGIEL